MFLPGRLDRRSAGLFFFLSLNVAVVVVVCTLRFAVISVSFFGIFGFWGKLGENGQQKSDKVKMAVITALAFFLLGCC